MLCPNTLSLVLQDKGLGIRAATMVLVAYGGGGAVGVLGGGALGQQLHNK